MQVGVNGATVFWSLAETSDGTKLKAIFESLGLRDHAPAMQTSAVALRRALEELYPAKKDADNRCYLVRSLLNSGDKEFAVAQETRGTQKNDYLHVGKFSLDALNNIVADYDGNMVQNPPELRAAYSRNCGYVPNANLSRALIDVATKLGAVSLRPTGGIYWVPEHNLGTFVNLGNAIMGAGLSNTNRFYVIRTLLDTSALVAIKDAIVADVEMSAKTISERVQTGNLKHRALTARRNDAIALHDRIRMYESILGEALDGLHKNVNVVEQECVESMLAAFPDALNDIVSRMAASNPNFSEVETASMS